RAMLSGGAAVYLVRAPSFFSTSTGTTPRSNGAPVDILISSGVAAKVRSSLWPLAASNFGASSFRLAVIEPPAITFNSAASAAASVAQAKASSVTIRRIMSSPGVARGRAYWPQLKVVRRGGSRAMEHFGGAAYCLALPPDSVISHRHTPTASGGHHAIVIDPSRRADRARRADRLQLHHGRAGRQRQDPYPHRQSWFRDWRLGRQRHVDLPRPSLSALRRRHQLRLHLRRLRDEFLRHGQQHSPSGRCRG